MDTAPFIWVAYISIKRYSLWLAICKLKPEWDTATHQFECLKNTGYTKSCWGWGATGTLFHCSWQRKTVQPSKHIWQFFCKVKYIPIYYQVISLHGIYQREMKINIHIKNVILWMLYIHTWMFIAALLVIGKELKYKCSSTNEWIAHCRISRH